MRVAKREAEKYQSEEEARRRADGLDDKLHDVHCASD